MKAKIIFPLLALFFLSCNEDDYSQPQRDENTFTAVRSDQNWSGITEIGLTTEDTLIFVGVADGGADDGVVVAKVKFMG
ncbi:MAG: hypothetical protein WA951_09850, partial [Leeuwenhoekiella sp.]